MSYKGNLLKVFFLGLLTLAGCKKDKNHHLEQSPVQTEMSHIGNVVLGGVTLDLLEDKNFFYAAEGDSVYPIAEKKFSLFGSDTSQDNRSYQKRRQEGYKRQDWETETDIGPYIPPDSLRNKDYVKGVICQELGLSPESVSIETHNSKDLKKNMETAGEFIDPSYPSDLKLAKSLLDGIMYDADTLNFNVWRHSKNPLNDDVDYIGICNIMEQKSDNIKVEAKYDGTVYILKVKGK